MCATIEFSLKKQQLTEKDVKRVEALFQKSNFDYRISYYEKMLKDTEQREKEYEQWKKDNPEKAVEFEKMRKEIEEKFKDVDVEFEVEEAETEYTEKEKNTLVILTSTHNKRCLCSFDDKELLFTLFDELLDIFDEVHYDSAADSYGSFSPFSWKGETVYSLSKDKDTLPWEPEMGYGPLIQIIK